jgi:CRISPR-associated protein Csc3
MQALENLAKYAAAHRIRGRSYKRNSMLKPLDIILDELDRCPNTKDEDELKLVRDGSKGLILDHVKRVAKGVHEDAVYEYVEMFFKYVLNEAHHKNANKLLQRERLIRSAYLVYMRQALAEIFIARGKAKSADEALQVMETDASQERDDESDE